MVPFQRDQGFRFVLKAGTEPERATLLQRPQNAVSLLWIAEAVGIDELTALPGIGEESANRIVEGPVSAIRFSTLAAICDGLGCEPGDVLRYTA